VWTLFIVGLGLWDARHEMQIARELAKNEARAHFLKDQAFRFWGAAHGGVYVPPTEKTPPNPHLSHLPHRDVVTTAGQKLTLISPACMVRQIMEDFGELYNARGRITSLNPLRPENAPDKWERAAFESFERGETEVMAFTKVDGVPCLRMMRPMVVKTALPEVPRASGLPGGRHPGRHRPLHADRGVVRCCARAHRGAVGWA